MQQNKVGEQKLYRLFGHFSLALVIGLTSLHAESKQSFADFKKTQTQSFQTYKDERDNAFNSYLKEQFKAYNVYKGTPLYEKPKPRVIKPTQEVKQKPVGPKISIKIKKFIVVEPKPEEIIKKEPEIKQEPKPIEDVKIPKKEEPVVVVPVIKYDLNFDFYGSELGFNVPAKLKSANFYPQNQKGITNFFASAASSEYEDLISDITKTSKELNLNDWGVYLLVLKISDSVFSDTDNSKLMSWFIFNKMGYAVKVGLASRHIVLMHYSNKLIYATPSYNFGKKKYYVVSNYAKGDVGRLFSYKQDYPGSTKALDLALETMPKFKSNMIDKTLEFKQFGNTYKVPFEYNKNLIDFMATYPQADYATFFNAPLEDKTYKSIASSLKKHLDGKKASEAMNFVLSFVQKSFKYERDNQQFGREKVMFAQETLYFDKSDCEDRAVLFSYLIKELFHVPVVGVKYKDHMATAIYVPMDGDKIIAKSKKFVVADPTYINANIGMSMPKYKSIKPQSYIVVKKD